jgi:hypothetical protein
MQRQGTNSYADYGDIVIEKPSTQPGKKPTKQSPTPYQNASNLKTTLLYNTC